MLIEILNLLLHLLVWMKLLKGLDQAGELDELKDLLGQFSAAE